MYSEDAVVAIYLNHLSGIGRRATTIGLQHNPAAVVCPLKDVRRSPSGHWMVADELYILWVQPTASRW